MRKIVLFICFIFLLPMCTACVNFYPITITGVLESETPKMRITMNTDPHKFGSDGELIQDDNTVIRIVLSISHGSFCIYEYKEFQENEMPGPNTPILYQGECRQKGDTIVLYVDDGSEIVLEKVVESSE